MPTENRSSSTDLVSVPRELTESIIRMLQGSGGWKTAEQLRALLAQSAEQQQGEQVAWSPVKPSTPGAYWVRGNGLDQDALIQVIDDQGELRCNLHQCTTETDFGYGYAVSDLSEEFEWLGPLYNHADAGEVERLRAQLAEANTAAEQLLQSRDIAQEQVRIREAKLAERDTLLADACALARFTLPDAWHARYAALSASAEPQVKS